jgi:hypothetical protein
MPDNNGKVVKIRIIDKPERIEEIASAVCDGLEKVGLEVIEQSKPKMYDENSPDDGKARLYLVAVR